MSSPTRRAAWFSTNAARAVAMSWAAAVLVAAVSLSAEPGRAHDLTRIATWVRTWVGGGHLYGAGADVDYPPWAIVTFAPLAWVPAAWVTGVWIAVNALLAATLVRLLSRDRVDPGGAWAWLVAAAAMGRTLNQFSLLCIVLGVIGLRRGRLAWLWLGLSLAKPQLGLVFVIARVWQGGAGHALASLAVPVAFTGVYALVAGVPVWGVPADVLAAFVGQQSGLSGRTELVDVVRSLAPGLSQWWVSAGIAVLIASPVAWMRTARGRLGVLALTTLLAVRHQSYDLVLLLPWVAGLSGLWFWAGALLITLDPSALIAVAEHALQVPPRLSVAADRAALLVLWAWLAWCGWQKDKNGHNTT